jgi:hypothetical protein
MSGAFTQIDVEILARAERAVLVRTGDGGGACWLSLALVEVTASERPGRHALTLPEWLAIREGLI